MAKAPPLKLGLSEALIAPLPPESKKKIFVICPVRSPHIGFWKQLFRKTFGRLLNIKDEWKEIQDAIRIDVEKLESEGNEVFWPKRDNPYQNTDKIGIQIITFNREKMLPADEIRVWYYKTSGGSIFDYGMFFAFVRVSRFKKLVIVNRDKIKPTPHKSFENVLLALEKEFDSPVANNLKNW
jgi:hypothetical protein